MTPGEKRCSERNHGRKSRLADGEEGIKNCSFHRFEMSVRYPSEDIKQAV